MTESETIIPQSTDSYLSLKIGQASKNGARSTGYIHYRILTDPSPGQLYLTIVGNDGGGCFSKEILSFSRIEQSLQGIDIRKPISSKLFQQAFTGRSANNGGFLAAILRAEQLLAPAPDSVHQHVVQPDWAAWKTAMLALAPDAEHYQPEPPKARHNLKTTDKEKDRENNQSNEQKSQQQPTTATEPAAESNTNESTDGDSDELDDSEMGYLLCDSPATDISSQQSEDEVEPAGTAVTVPNKQSKKRNEKRPHPTGQESRP